MESNSGKRPLGCTALGTDFYKAKEVASRWIVDFMCYCLSRYFGAGMFQEFRVMRDAMNDFVQQPSVLESNQAKKVHLCQILARIVEGNSLDVQFDNDENVTPLESALMVLIEMVGNNEIQKDALYADLKQLLQIQSVAVCMEKGNFKKASEVLERQFQKTTTESEQSLKRKLTLIIIKKDPYHKFLNNFNYKRMIESAESLANRMLNEKNSNFLFQAAQKVVDSIRKRDANMDSSEDESNHDHQEEKCESSLRDNGDSSNTNFNTKRSKKRLYSLVDHKSWKPIKSDATKDFLGERERSPGRVVASVEQNACIR
ncbi:telomeric repeat-binding factor 1 isoform X3 [Narcine bancroftii]|uniref:telomeric repeat-binding factor 1 isoform X3 n=1 Tax=Narcine bancroftii TaxID=1343680 RepID=UPI003831AD72